MIHGSIASPSSTGQKKEKGSSAWSDKCSLKKVKWFSTVQLAAVVQR